MRLGSATPQEQPRTAEDWFARLSSDSCTATDRMRFEQWRSASPDNERAYRDVERLWRRSGALHRFPDIVEAMDAPAPRRRPRLGRPALAAAASLVLAVGLLWLQPWAGSGERWRTATGEQRSIVLADGSTVLLDAESELRVRYDEHQRRLELRRGQAQFNVSRDPQRPFTVTAGNGRVTALGTAFQVRLIERALTVTLLEGSISVDAPAADGRLRSETLVVGEQLRVVPDRSEWQRAEADLEVVQGWTYGDLVFKEWRLADLIIEMNRYSPVRLRIEDPELDDLLISGRFHAGDHRALLRVLEGGWPVSSRVVGGDILLARNST